MDKYIPKVTMTHTFYLRLVNNIKYVKIERDFSKCDRKVKGEDGREKHSRKVGVTFSIHMNHFHPVYKT